MTGTSDALNTSFIMDMMFAPDVAKVGLLYLPSASPIHKPLAAREALTSRRHKGIEDVEQAANTNDECCRASALTDGVDAAFP